MWYIIAFVVGVIIGVIATALVARNNRKKFGSALDASYKIDKEIHDKYHKYIEKDSYDNPNKP